MNATIGKRIRKYREEKGFSQEELAEKLHISRSPTSGSKTVKPTRGSTISKKSAIRLR
ncbi:helix-turn-helix transcriptional regulator [Chryseobacterium gilvum]|uniref:helix-turn-helix transcriptional regulator n=1 Tax=Chryseobacterium gilvum TaxID=2976534 RepID=UPI0034A53AB3